MKLFGNNKETEQTEALSAAEPIAAPVVAEAEEKLVLDIEGLEEKAEEKIIPALKAETRELPKKEEILIQELRADLETEQEAPAEDSLEEQEAPVEDNREAQEPPAGESREEPKAPPAPEEAFRSVTYESVAEAVETAKKEPTGRFNRDAIDDETLLAELYTLIGDSKSTQKASASSSQDKPAVRPRSMHRPEVRLTPQDLQAAPEEYEELMEDDSVGVPGWIKGVFILLISMLLSAMTFYAVATDVIGKLF